MLVTLFLLRQGSIHHPSQDPSRRACSTSPLKNPDSQVLEPGLHPGGDSFHGLVHIVFLKRRWEDIEDKGEKGSAPADEELPALNTKAGSFLAGFKGFPWSQDPALAPGFYS